MGMAAMLVMYPGALENFFIPSTPRGSIWNLVSIGPVVLEQILWNCQNLRFLGQRSKNDLDLLYSHIFMYSLRWLYIPIFRPKSSKLTMKSHVLAFSHIWPCRKKGQGQPRVIIWTILIVLEYPMLHTEFQGHRSTGSGEEDFSRFLPYMGVVAMLVMWPGPYEQIFIPSTPGGSICNLITIGLVVFEEIVWYCQNMRVLGQRSKDDLDLLNS